MKNTAMLSHTTGNPRVLRLDAVRTGVGARVSGAVRAVGHHVRVRPKATANPKFAPFPLLRHLTR